MRTLGFPEGLLRRNVTKVRGGEKGGGERTRKEGRREIGGGKVGRER